METSFLDRHFEPYFKQWNIDTSFFPLTHLEFPIGMLLFYIVTVSYFQPASNTSSGNTASSTTRKRSGNPSSSSLMQKIVLSGHNLILCIFSVSCFVNTAPVIYHLMVHIGWSKASCGLMQKEYESTYGLFSWLFYLSKYYEFADTYIVIWKGRRPLFLQTYHHCGAVIGMWLAVTTRTTCGYIFVVENSAIHSIMYLYYALTVWRIRVPFKFMITILQMFQFVFGMSLGVVQLMWFAECLTVGDQITIWYMFVYTALLFVLFIRFYIHTYRKKRKKQ
mmetsp:Transcript_61782/g.98461  ORF Transcript_61782/g.98461 Transcript_61782/m.98461 type:complete len:278 (-) Transcript_61782:166-999(-)